MANSGADIFLILLRPTRVPIAGEAVSHLFEGQVHLESLNWNLHNEDERKRADAADNSFYERKNVVDRAGSAPLRLKHATEDLHRAQAARDVEFQKDADRSDAEAFQKDFLRYRRERAELFKSYQDKVAEIAGKPNAPRQSFEDMREQFRAQQIEDADRNRNFEFTFKKRVDIASTQMLNSMKAGDILPSGTLTIHKRSATVMDGTSLVFTIQKVRLLDYNLEVVVTDTMTEMMEQWTCEFGALAYVYKNPPSHSEHGSAAQAVVKAATQGTVRAFTMKNIGSPI